ncbi:MAG TPA: pyruvate ferredoxin oxidoreductase [Thermoplasmatales archaeon]|nr:MAG: pyruvate ferredoxin oxidoreductase [Thermoplasmata archaeon]RLF32954.1 MAG: pyruvate ferredoxin oxidoreductase [Thermoplasmata archaeon]HDN50155.1 pyruvate ferredoxin oxidoreductase [Thermoplasmatales archaeon]
MIQKLERKKMVITGDYAAAYGGMISGAEVVAAYPITPQTLIVEDFATFVNDGITDAEFIMVESEHSAMSACIAAQAAGARTFTATSSQGLALMHEMLFIAASLRLPIVMPVVNRTVAAPIGIWCEYNDSMPQRDTGWMQMSCEDNQEVLDMVIMSYKIAEHRDVLLPIMPCLDAFILSHTVEPVEAPSSDEVAQYLGKYEPVAKLDTENPMAIGTFAPPEYIQELRYHNHMAMENAKRVIREVTRDFARTFGHDYHGLIEEYRCDDADVVLITIGTVTGTAREVVDELRERGKKVGLVKLRFYRPFPREELQKIAERVGAIGVYDRAVSFGSGGPMFIETRHALYGHSIPIMNFLAGIGGRDVMKKDVEKMFEMLLEAKEGKTSKEIVWIGTRGVTP